MKQMRYSLRVRYPVRFLFWTFYRYSKTFEHAGYFDNTDIFRSHLARWNGTNGPAGSTYEYFETAAQAAANDQARHLPKDHRYPAFSLEWTGKQLHEYVRLDERSCCL